MTYVLPAGATTRTALHLQSLGNRDRFLKKLEGKEPLVQHVSAILRTHNPVGLHAPARDEYRPEAETIVASLSSAITLPEVLTIVHREFTNWFDDMAGPATRYTKVASEVWQASRMHFTGAIPIVLRNTDLPPSLT